MTADDFYLLFVGFAGFVAAPSLLLWGVFRLSQGLSRGRRGPDQRSGMDRPSGPGGQGKAERSNYADSNFAGLEASAA